MHTLYPLLQEKEELTPGGDIDDNNVLSKELKENFETMRAMLKAQPEDEKKDDNDVSSGRKRKREEHAAKTALAVESEISRLKGGIAELEALLAETESGEVPVVAFPSLPPIVVPDDDDSQQDEEPEIKSGGLVEG